MIRERIYNYQAYVTRIRDGDTMSSVIDLGCDVKINAVLRLEGVDTPELRNSDLELKAKALIATQAACAYILGATKLYNWEMPRVVDADAISLLSREAEDAREQVALLTPTIFVHTIKKESFGRYLATVENTEDFMTLNDYLLASGLATVYKRRRSRS